MTEVLTAYARALRREAHFLTRAPELTWQQLHNRLQWEGDELATRLASERQRRSRPDATPWMRLATPLRESEALQRTLTGHTDTVVSCAFSPDGHRIVSTSGDHTLKLWDADTGAELRTLTGHTEGIWCGAFSPDGRRIVSAGHDHTLKLWDADTGAELHTLTGHTKEVVGCAFSPDGRRIVSASGDHTLKLWDADTGVERRTLTGHTDIVDGCAFSPDGRRIVSASRDRTLRLWEAESGSPVAHVELPGDVPSASCHPWRPWVACGDLGGVLYRIEVMGTELGPIIVTASQSGPQLMVRCPACQTDHPLDRAELGSDFTCTTEGCGLNLRVNTLVLSRRHSPSTDGGGGDARGERGTDRDHI